MQKDASKIPAAQTTQTALPKNQFRATHTTAPTAIFFAITIICALCFFVVITAFVLPYCKALSPLFSPPAQSATPNARAGDIHIKFILDTLAFTFAESILSTILALAIGLPCAYFVTNKRFPFKKILLAFSAIPLCMPPLIIALGYISTFGVAGFFNNAAQFFASFFNIKPAPNSLLYSTLGIITVQGFYNFPLVMMTTSRAWQSMDTIHEDSARLLGASEGRVFFTISLPKLIPSIISSSIPIFLFCFFSFLLILIFGRIGSTTLEVAIYHASKSLADYRTSAALALIESAAAILFLLAYSSLENKTAHIAAHNATNNFRNEKFSASQAVLFSILMILVLCFFVTPLFSILISSFTSRQNNITKFSLMNWKNFFLAKSFLPALKNTFLTGIATAFLSTLCGTVYAVFARLFDKGSPNARSAMLKTIPLLPMALSSIVIGTGFAQVFRHANFLVLSLAQSSLLWPFAFRQIHPFIKKIPQETLDSSALLSTTALDTVFRIMLPYSKRGIVNALALSFAMSAGDATLPLALALPRYDNLSLLTYRLVSAYRFSQASCAGFFLAACVLIVCAFLYGERKNGVL